jgi:hypothetical protein
MGKVLGEVRSSKYLIPFTKDDLGIGKVVSFLYTGRFRIREPREYQASVIESGEEAMVARIMEIDPPSLFSGSSGNRKKFMHSRMFVYSINDPVPDKVPSASERCGWADMWEPGSDAGAHGEKMDVSGVSAAER